MTAVAFLWHMHQPYYEDLVTHEHILPWVRLHALKDYYGMVALLEEFPAIRATFNLVPSLLVQLEAFAADRAQDRYLELSLKPADALGEEEIFFILHNFFHAQRQRMIDVYPRYAELLGQRGSATGPADLHAAARRFSVDDLRDLQVWHKLAWLDPFYLAGDPRVRGLLEKARDFSEEDKLVLRTIELEILNAVIPAYRRRMEAGQIEISTSPYYHPILPLLCDTEVYKQTHPHSRMPRQRFTRPEDALEQLVRASTCHERLFGRRPVGLWPSEGSVSDAMVPLVTEAGFEWMATDELILARTLGTTFTRDADGHVDQPQRLYAPYRLVAGDRHVACGFRDHGLSDLIGFTYAGWDAEKAADDFVARLVEAGRRVPARDGQEPTIFVILDGENAWEYFDGGGRPFLRALYSRLSGTQDLRTVTMSEACQQATQTLPGIFPGSWIDANFYIWIGHADDQRAWSQLAEAREALDLAGASDAAARGQAHEEILIAEGSDWFWWYGDDHSSDHDLEFDDLFRRHLRNVYRLLQRPAPDELFVSNITTGAPASTQIDPTGFIRPVLDGEDSSYFEWLDAGDVEIRDVAGAMHQVDRRPQFLTRLRFGFDLERLYVRMDASGPIDELLAEGYSFTVTFLQPAGVRLLVRRVGERTLGSIWIRRTGQDQWVEHTFRGNVAAGMILEIEVPLADLSGAQAAGEVAFVATACNVGGVEIERHPLARPVRVQLPTPDFEARNWTA